MNPNSPASNIQSPVPSSGGMARGEKLVLGLGFVFLIILKLAYPFVLRYESDEAQHLHVVWAWTQGLVQYRDVFDNHTPLFHIALSPLAWAIGETPYILILMRLSVIPMCLLVLWCVYRISTSLFGHRTALWTVLATSLVPIFFFTSTEFRADDLWIVFWLLTLHSLLARKSPAVFRAGLFLGCAFATSMKTSLLLGSLLQAGLCLLAYQRILGRVREKTSVCPDNQAFTFKWTSLPKALAGILLIPILLLVYFYSKGAFADLYYCVVQHNVIPGMGNSKLGLHSLRFPIAFPFLFAIGFGIVRYSANPGLGARRALVFLTGGLFLALFRSYWPLVTAQSYLPFIPLAVIMATPVFLWTVDRLRPPVLRTGILALATASCFANTIKAHPFWDIETQQHVETLRKILKLTTPSDTVMDAKGETIFRRRAFYYALEGITLKRMELGLLPNTIVDRLIETQTPVVHDVRLDKLKGNTRAFVKANYCPVGNLQVLGQILNEKPSASGTTYQFTIAVPSEYQLVDEKGPVPPSTSALLNGTAWTQPMWLQPGKYELTISGTHGPLALFWARASNKGYSPF